MTEEKTNNRRAFVKTCLATATMVAANPALIAGAEPVRQYTRSRLVNENGEAISSRSLEPNKAYVFHYPYVTTPCFLINIDRPIAPGQVMDTESEGSYTWQGGAGPENSLVAFSAICTHKLSYPTKTLSFLNYRPEKVRFLSKLEKIEERSQVIYCCSENSAYDPSRGAEVIGGPARQPLAAIELEHDAESDVIHAIGSRGGELYEPFFEKFGFRLALDHKIKNVRATVEGTTIVYPHEEYSQHAVSC